MNAYVVLPLRAENWHQFLATVTAFSVLEPPEPEPEPRSYNFSYPIFILITYNSKICIAIIVLQKTNPSVKYLYPARFYPENYTLSKTQKKKKKGKEV